MLKMYFVMIYVRDMGYLAWILIQMFYCGFVEVNSQRSKGKKEERKRELVERLKCFKAMVCV